MHRVILINPMMPIVTYDLWLRMYDDICFIRNGYGSCNGIIKVILLCIVRCK